MVFETKAEREAREALPPEPRVFTGVTFEGGPEDVAKRVAAAEYDDKLAAVFTAILALVPEGKGVVIEVSGHQSDVSFDLFIDANSTETFKVPFDELPKPGPYTGPERRVQNFGRVPDRRDGNRPAEKQAEKAYVGRERRVNDFGRSPDRRKA